MKKSTILVLLLSMTSLCTFFIFCKKTSSQKLATHHVINLHEKQEKTRSSQSLLHSFSNTGNVILKFYADWCGPCRRMTETINNLLNSNLAATMPDFTLINISRDYFLDLGKTFSISSIPTLIFLRDGKEIKRYDGGPLTEQAFANLVNSIF